MCLHCIDRVWTTSKDIWVRAAPISTMFCGWLLNDNRLKNKYLNWRTIYEGCFMTNEYSDGKTKSLHVVCLPNERKVLTKIGDKNCKFADVWFECFIFIRSRFKNKTFKIILCVYTRRTEQWQRPPTYLYIPNIPTHILQDLLYRYTTRICLEILCDSDKMEIDLGDPPVCGKIQSLRFLFQGLAVNHSSRTIRILSKTDKLTFS